MVVDSLYKDLERRIVASPPGQCPVDMTASFLKLCHAQTCGKCVPCRIGPVSYTHLDVYKRQVEEAIHSEQIGHRNMVIELEDKTLGKLKMPGMNIKLSGEPDEPAFPAPLLGEDTNAILTMAGYSGEEIADLQARGIIKASGGEKQ